MIKKYLKRLVYRTDNEMLNPLMHLFLFITLCFSLAFIFFGSTESVQAIVLYSESVRIVGGNAFNFWGTLGLLVTIGNTLMLLFREKVTWLAEPVTLTGMFLWLYAAIIYLNGGYVLQVLVAAVPNFLFWCWYYVRVTRYRNNPPKAP